jgi:hypothetical protein
MESSAKTRSAEPIAIITTTIGVIHRLPSRLTVSLAPWNSLVTGTSLRSARNAMFSSNSTL